MLSIVNDISLFKLSLKINTILRIDFNYCMICFDIKYKYGQILRSLFCTLGNIENYIAYGIDVISMIKSQAYYF